MYTKLLIVLAAITIVGMIILILVFPKGYLHRSRNNTDNSLVRNISAANYYQYLGPTNTSLQEIVEDINPDIYAISALNYLHTCGLIQPKGYYLVTEEGLAIRNRDELLGYIGPIDTPEKAIVLFYAFDTICALRSEYKSAKQFVDTTATGFRVRIVLSPSFGCQKM